MQRITLMGVGAFSIGTAVYIWAATLHWYNNVPGVVLTGPLNMHLAKDVALAYLASGIGLVWAGLKHDRSVGVLGASWLVFHAIFHMGMWMHRGFPLDYIAFVNLVGIQFPSFLALFLAINIQTERGKT